MTPYSCSPKDNEVNIMMLFFNICHYYARCGKIEAKSKGNFRGWQVCVFVVQACISVTNVCVGVDEHVFVMFPLCISHKTGGN